MYNGFKAVAPSWFESLKEVIRKDFWPTLFGSTVSDDEAMLFTLPTRMGGMGVRDPTDCIDKSYEASLSGSSLIIERNKGGVLSGDHYNHFISAGGERRLKQWTLDNEKLSGILNEMDELKSRAIKRAIEGKCSNWLNVVPMYRYGFVLSMREFRDAIAFKVQEAID